MTIGALLLCLAAAAPAPAEPALARAGDTTITRADVDERRRVLAARGRTVTHAQAVADLVDEALLAADARAAGLDRDAAVVAQIEEQRRRLAFDAYAAEIARSAEPSEAQLRELYHRGADTLRLVLVKVEREADARAVLERVRRGADLADEASRSIDPKLARSRGDTGTVVRAVLDPALATAAAAAPVGSLVGPVQLQLGWAVARVVERAVADESFFPSRREALAAFARQQAQAQARAHLAEQAKRAARVTIDEQAFEALSARASLGAEDLGRPVATINGRPVAYREVEPAIRRHVSATRGHGARPRAKLAALQQEIESRLLADAALAKGFGSAPEVVATLAGIERNILAGALAARLAGRPADTRDPKVRERLEALRARTRISVDEKRIAALGAKR